MVIGTKKRALKYIIAHYAKKNPNRYYYQNALLAELLLKKLEKRYKSGDKHEWYGTI